MSRLRLLALISMAATMTVACTDQNYTPIGEETSDELCRQSNLELTEVSQVALELDASGQASYSESIEVTLFSRTEMRVDTDEIIVSVPANSIARVSVAEGNWDLFTDMVFAVDMRKPGETVWEPMILNSSKYDLFWFKEIEINAVSHVSAVSTLTLCTASEVNADDLAIDLEGDYELRIRPFPFEGLGDLVGQYDYTIHVDVTE